MGPRVFDFIQNEGAHTFDCNAKLFKTQVADEAIILIWGDLRDKEVLLVKQRLQKAANACHGDIAAMAEAAVNSEMDFLVSLDQRCHVAALPIDVWDSLIRGEITHRLFPRTAAILDHVLEPRPAIAGVASAASLVGADVGWDLHGLEGN